MVEISVLHHVSTNKRRVGPRAQYNVSPKRLATYLNERRNWKSKMPKEDNEKDFVLLTFDDGYRNNLTTALPVIEKFEKKAIIFITTEFISRKAYPYELELASVIEHRDGLIVPDRKMSIDIGDRSSEECTYQRLRRPLKTKSHAAREAFMEKLAVLNGYKRDRFQDEPILSWEEVIELDRHSLVTIGAHTRTHPVLTRRFPWTAYREMKSSKQVLERMLGREVKHFSYPYGRNNILVRTLARLAGFRWAFTTERRRIENLSTCNPMALPRLDIQELV